MKSVESYKNIFKLEIRSIIKSQLTRLQMTQLIKLYPSTKLTEYSSCKLKMLDDFFSCLPNDMLDELFISFTFVRGSG